MISGRQIAVRGMVDVQAEDKGIAPVMAKGLPVLLQIESGDR
jgi:hypothetical protein